MKTRRTALDLIVVFDSNVLIPMSIDQSHSVRLFLRLRQAKGRVFSSPHILAEVGEKKRTKKQLRKWLGLTDKKINRFLTRLPKLCPPTAGVLTAEGAVPADPKDDKVVAAALECGAGYIVSEDRHLLDMGEWKGIKIMNRKQFEAELDRLKLGPLKQQTKRKRRK